MREMESTPKVLSIFIIVVMIPVRETARTVAARIVTTEDKKDKTRRETQLESRTS